MIEDIMENEKYEGMKKERKIEPDGNGEDNKLTTEGRHSHVTNLLSRTPKEDRGYRPDSNHHFVISTDGHRPLAKITN